MKENRRHSLCTSSLVKEGEKKTREEKAEGTNRKREERGGSPLQSGERRLLDPSMQQEQLRSRIIRGRI